MISPYVNIAHIGVFRYLGGGRLRRLNTDSGIEYFVTNYDCREHLNDWYAGNHIRVEISRPCHTSFFCEFKYIKSTRALSDNIMHLTSMFYIRNTELARHGYPIGQTDVIIPITVPHNSFLVGVDDNLFFGNPVVAAIVRQEMRQCSAQSVSPTRSQNWVSNYFTLPNQEDCPPRIRSLAEMQQLVRSHQRNREMQRNNVFGTIDLPLLQFSQFHMELSNHVTRVMAESEIRTPDRLGESQDMQDATSPSFDNEPSPTDQVFAQMDEKRIVQTGELPFKDEDEEQVEEDSLDKLLGDMDSLINEGDDE